MIPLRDTVPTHSLPLMTYGLIALNVLLFLYEARLGGRRYLLFYLLSGAVAAYSQFRFAPRSGIPMVGASGAIAGVMGGYFILFPRARVVALVPAFFAPHVVPIPAVFFLGFWFLLQFFNGAFSL